MKTSVFARFIILYAVIALVAIFTTMTLGSFFIQKNCIENESEFLCSESASLSSGDAALSFSKSNNISDLYDDLKTLSAAQKTTILIFNTAGDIILDTDSSSSTVSGEKIADFDYSAITGRYTIDNFYGHFQDEQLTAISPILNKMKVVGYLTISLPMSTISEHVSSMVHSMLIIVGIVLALAALLIILLVVSVIAPLHKIKTGADEITAGHLDYRIKLVLDDEFSQVANSLNNMAQEIQQSSEYQRTFISNVSHDFRSPLTSIKGFTEAMTDGTIPPELHPKYLKIIQSEAERLEKLTRSTLTLENLDRRRNNEQVLDIKDFDINQVIRNTAAVFEGSCRSRKISFNLTLFEDGLYVRADKEKIQQVLYNLIDNAIKFSEDNATIFLETKIKKGKCVVSVRDEGAGIPEENIDKIWERFYKSDPSRGKDKKGTGLGLSIVQEIIRAHDENITVTSSLGVGTRFRFTLALGKEPE
jgi:signal transduction histidine kinase